MAVLIGVTSFSLSLSLSIAHLFNYWTIFSFIHWIDDMVVDFFADLTEVKENLIKTWFLVGYREKKKEKGNIRNLGYVW